MNIKTATLLSNSEFLTEELQNILFKTGYQEVRRNLSANKFLSPKIKYKFLDDERSIQNILSHPQNDLYFLELALKSAKQEHTLMKFTSQPLLDEKLIYLLGKKATPMVAYYLASHPNASDEIKIKLFKKYLKIHQPINPYSVKELTDRFGKSSKLWAKILKVLDLEQVLIASATLPLIKSGELDPLHLINYLKRITPYYEKMSNENPNWFRTQPYANQIKNLEYLANELASMVTMKPNHLRILTQTNFLTKAKLKALESLEYNFYSDYKFLSRIESYMDMNILTASEKKKAISIIKKMLTKKDDYSLPSALLASLALKLSNHIDEKELSIALELIRGPQSRMIASKLYQNHEYEQIYLLVKNLSTLTLDELNLDSKTIKYLSQKAVIDFHNKDYIRKYDNVIVNEFMPLYLITSEPHLLGLIIKKIDELNIEQRETAHALLPDWTQNLSSLILAAVSLSKSQ